MTPQQSWATLVLGFTIFISPLTAFPIPIPAENAIRPETAGEIQARSAVPDPRLIPNETDLMAAILAGLGMQELEKFNKLHTDMNGQDSGATMVIDDSRASTPTVTELENNVDNGKEKGMDTAKDDANAAKDPEGFVDTLFEVLKKKFREAINGSDEIGLV
ncbi:predicted protein [Aspergillus nidulans FGSC A4]|uniref:Uncharacterized protein n=1 Tax=Emericella nidulans (strain FGSC A4 / ATCC 38163 / CBS 112.46 / NRRL 194 / M139) TaxID=227321 RepID=Q5BDX7_EMENI|nr:hypothetical protein [Aspergillus nidulans FGSC A4]EAA65846.1 predicted protein [Aspergillus nidulans FGSC A4]CBF87849.1 TPA: conserved hypothetical protein [Aspergillus nidulans FGSC A4]|eukprot:XP_658857.1 predicted protein [Aspergillus nidulans FGSC A4]